MLSGPVPHSYPGKRDARLMCSSWEMTQGKIQVKNFFKIQLNFKLRNSRARPKNRYSECEARHRRAAQQPTDFIVSVQNELVPNVKQPEFQCL